MIASETKRIDLDKLEKVYPHTYFSSYNGIAEPGYDDVPVILADWNPVPYNVQKAIEEKLGWMVEWEDEWIPCGNCGKLVRTSPDCYQWQPSYVFIDDEVYCLDCMDAEEYYRSIENHSKKAVTLTIQWKHPVEEYGYELVQGKYENGFFDGQDDDPKAILKRALESEPDGRFLFVMTDQGQFDIEFALYRKVKGED